MDKQVVTYEPDNSIKKGLFLIITEIFSEINQNKWLTYQLFKRDFSTIYKQTLIGILWIFVMPIINVFIFILLSHSGIFNYGKIGVPYPLYALLGMSFWQLFSSGVINASGALTAVGDMITRINFSKKSLVIATIGKPIISFFIQLILIVVLFIVYKIAPSKGIVLVPFVIIPIIFLTMGLGFIISLLNAIIKDTGTLLSVSMTLLMYVTPVLYAKPEVGILSQITKYNPMYYMLSAGRDLILYGKIVDIGGFLLSSIISFLILAISLIFFHLTEARVTERI